MDAIISRILLVPWYSYALLIGGAVVIYGSKAFINRRGFDEEKSEKYIINLKMAGLALVVAGAVMTFL